MQFFVCLFFKSLKKTCYKVETCRKFNKVNFNLKLNLTCLVRLVKLPQDCFSNVFIFSIHVKYMKRDIMLCYRLDE